MAGNFGRLLKFLYLAEFTFAEFTLAVWQSLYHNDIHNKWANPDNRARLLESLWGVHALLFDHDWVTFVPILFPWMLQCTKAFKPDFDWSADAHLLPACDLAHNCTAPTLQLFKILTTFLITAFTYPPVINFEFIAVVAYQVGDAWPSVLMQICTSCLLGGWVISNGKYIYIHSLLAHCSHASFGMGWWWWWQWHWKVNSWKLTDIPIDKFMSLVFSR